MYRLNDGGCTVFVTFLEWPITDHRNSYCTFINQICLVRLIIEMVIKHDSSVRICLFDLSKYPDMLSSSWCKNTE